jgi:protein required for attachment to host cells
MPTQHRNAEVSSDMTKIHLPHDAFVFVGDGSKALFLRNEGDDKFPNLKTERVFTDVNPLTHEQGTDRPGRLLPSVGTARASVEATDWHNIEAHRFADQVAAALQHIVRERHVKAVVIVAPPRTLAELRRVLHPDVEKHIIAEIDKDLTGHPVYDIEKHLAA